MEINHVLIVEDDAEIRKGVEIYLKSRDIKCIRRQESRMEGLEIIEKEEIHLAIVDVMMPRMDGIAMTIKLREKHDFPVIFLSAKSEEVDKIMGLNIGARRLCDETIYSNGTVRKGKFPASSIPEILRKA